MSSFGKVYLVGAGPGDAGLLTLRGADVLGRADLVLYDYLVNPDVLSRARTGAELICLGRHGQGRLMSQDEVNQRMIAACQSGKSVVRLKGGDPVVFARAGEELDALSAAGCPLEIVPGVTAALAVGSYAGIPITHRDASSAVALVTGQEQTEKEGSLLDWKALAQFPGTLVIYMGVTTAAHWTAALLAAGKRESTPAAIVRRCSWPDQEVWQTTLGEVAGVLESEQIRPPAVVVLGDVVSLGETYAWFQRRPLFGQTILVTRPQEQAEDLRGRLEELGARVLVQPAIRIADPDDWAPVDRAIEDIASYDWLVFSSANGVAFFLQRLFQLGKDLRALGTLRLAVIGPATARKLREYHLAPDLQPEEYRAEALAEALSSDAEGDRFLLVRASRGREILAEQLTAAGGNVDQVVVYSSTDVEQPEAAIAQAMQEGRIDWTTVTSSAIARSLAAMFGPSLEQTKLVSISPVTTGVLRELGYEPAAEAAQYTMDGLIEATREAVASEKSRRDESV